MPTDDRRLEPGTTVLGDVRLESFVCGRGLGSLYRGTSTSSGARLWVRVMSAAALARAADLFAREVSVARHLEHGGSLAPLDAGVSSETGQAVAAVVYEPCEGVSLQTLVSDARLPIADVARITTELASVLDHAHRQPAPLVHGALSTASVILGGKSREARLLDLGIVQALDRVDAFDEAKWELLDPSVFAPEQTSRAFPIGPATDVFGLASIVFECLTGHVAFPATHRAEAEALVIGARPSAHRLRREVPPAIDRLLARAWSVDPRSRPNDIAAFARAIAAELTPADEDDEATVNIPPESKAPPPKAPRAQTLPFGMPAIASEPPAKPIEKEPIANPPAPAPADPRIAPDPRAEIAAPELRVVNVTAMLISLLLSGAIVIAGAMLAATRYLARPAPPSSPPVVTTVVVAPSVTATPIASATASVSATTSAAPHEAPPAPSASAPLWPVMAKEPGPRPSTKAIEVLQGRLKTAIEPCMKITPRPPPGMPWMVHFELDGPTGSPALVEVSRPYKGTLAGACILRAALDARVPPFDAARWATDLRFAP